MSYLNKKSKNLRLDEVDLSILRYIQESPKTRIREIASKLGLPKSTIYYRMRKLEELKVIKGYNAILDSEKLGFEYLVIILVRGKYGPKYHEEIGKFLSRNPYIQAVYYVLGETDFVVIGKFPYKEKYLEFLETLINSQFIERTNTMVIARVVKEDFKLNI